MSASQSNTPPTTPDQGVAAVISIDPREDVAAICGRLDSAPTFSVVLHAPRGNQNLATEYGLRRLRRHAEEGGHSVAIATTNRSLATRALAAGFPVARQPTAIRWDAPGRTLVNVLGMSLALPPLGIWPGVLAITAGIVVMLAIALFALPSATVVVTLSGESLSTETEVTVVQSNSAENPGAGILVSRPTTFQDTVVIAVPATGTAEVPVTAATVVVSITAPATGLTIPAGAVLLAGTVRFRLDNPLSLGPAETQSATATASAAGPSGNVAAGAVDRWEDSAHAAARVTNPTAAGGGATATRAVVTEADIKLAQERAKTLEVSPAVRDRLVRARSGELIISESLDVEVMPGDPLIAPGTPADLALVEVRLEVKAEAVPAEALEALAVGLYGSDKRTILPGSVAAVQVGPSYNGESGRFARVRVTAVGVSPIDEAAVRGAVKGKRPGDAKANLLSRYRMDDVEIRLSPGWAPFVPRLGGRIQLELHAASGEKLETIPGS